MPIVVYFQALEEKERKNRQNKDKLNREQRYLRRRLEYLTEGQYRLRERVERTFSESSSSTSSSVHSSASSISSTNSPPSEAGKYTINITLNRHEEMLMFMKETADWLGTNGRRGKRQNWGE